MKHHLHRLARWMLGLSLLTLGVAALYLNNKQPMRDGVLPLAGLSAPVEVRYDDQGVPHIRAENETDLYRALGYVQAQDRLFQMELLRRLARGELAELFGRDLLDRDRLFRTLRLREQAAARVEAADRGAPYWLALQAYLDGINQFQANRPLPLEFDLLGIEPRPFTPEDSFSVIGYMAWSFAQGLRTEPALTWIRDNLGRDHLEIFELPSVAAHRIPGTLVADDWDALQQLSLLASRSPGGDGLPQFEGSNAWAIAGSRTASGLPLLAGDPHIRFSLPQVWFQAHLSMPGFELQGQYHALLPFALLGQSAQRGWSLTMLQNDDLDLIVEPASVPKRSHTEDILIRGGDHETITLQEGEYGPWINTALGELAGPTPIALRWGFYNPDSRILEAFYQLGHAREMFGAREAVRGIDSPGLNVIWADAEGNIAHWTAARLWRRPVISEPHFILDSRLAEADAPDYRPFSTNPRVENPASGFVLSANQRTDKRIPGYYNLSDRYQHLLQQLESRSSGWDAAASQQMQLGDRTDYGPRTLEPVIRELKPLLQGDELILLQQLARWDGSHGIESREATLFNQLLYQIAHEAMADEMGEPFFQALLGTRAILVAMPNLIADPESPWWDDHHSPQKEARADILLRAWDASLAHLREELGRPTQHWRWGAAHTLTFRHPLGGIPLLGSLLNVGSYPAPGAHEMPNNLAQKFSPAPWPVIYGPSVRFTLDFGLPEQAQIIHPLGQSGVPFNRHYNDQTADYLAGRYRPLYLLEQDIAQHVEGTLRLVP